MSVYYKLKFIYRKFHPKNHVVNKCGRGIGETRGAWENREWEVYGKWDKKGKKAGF